jgi:hypothetical protein
MAPNLRMVLRGAALVFVLLLSGGAHGQAPPSGTSVAPLASLEQNCSVIREAFKLARFTGAFKRRAAAWLDAKCVGDVPLPVKGDSDNIQRFNTVSFILDTGGGIKLVP